MSEEVSFRERSMGGFDREKRKIVTDVCKYIDCANPETGEEAFDWIYNTYMEGVNYVYNDEDYPIQELAENEVPYNNYKIATIWTQLQLYNERPDDFRGFISTFQFMLYEVAERIVGFAILTEG